jgi:hypothetical protein
MQLRSAKMSIDFLFHVTSDMLKVKKRSRITDKKFTAFFCLRNSIDKSFHSSREIHLSSNEGKLQCDLTFLMVHKTIVTQKNRDAPSHQVKLLLVCSVGSFPLSQRKYNMNYIMIV